ncbi:MAG: cytochrome c oxidase assembly protein, partial [Planctomycetales bacterium]|nr:cytochrome c oxidase assembly protein [Planctomycetales bacterium]
DWGMLLKSWNLTPATVIWLAIIGVVYTRGWLLFQHRSQVRFPLQRLLCFVVGLITILFALQSPLDVAAAFSLQAHMVQHLLLMIVAPPLLLYGAPTLPLIAGLPRAFRQAWVTPFATWKPIRRLLACLVRPTTTWVLFTVMLWAWHVPLLYELALQSGYWHRVEHACFLATSLLFWWPVFQPYPSRSTGPRWALVPYLFLAGIQGSALAAILTFSPQVLYSHYDAVPNVWGLAPLTDQSLAGAIMWVPTAGAFLIAMLYVVSEQISAESSLTQRADSRNRRKRSNQPLATVAARALLTRPAATKHAERSERFATRFALHVRRPLRLVMVLLAGVVVIDGLTGPQVSSLNLAGVLPWIHWRGLLVITLVLGGNFFCMICPFTALRTLAKQTFSPTTRWPLCLRNKWLAILLLMLFFWSYEAFSLWDRPLVTALITLGYFAVAFLFDAVFVDAPFCKFVCPIGQFNFVQSLFSPAQVAIASSSRCAECRTRECIRGTLRTPGCQTELFQPTKYSNMDCTFCMDCVAACPHDNVTLVAISRTTELADDRQRSEIGRHNERIDVAALIAILFVAALVNAAWMTTPVIAKQASFVAYFGIGRLPVMTGGWLLGTVVIPLLLILAISWASNRLNGLTTSKRTIQRNIACFAPSLIPVALGMWLAHYSFHLFTSFDGAFLAGRRAWTDWTGADFTIGVIECACCRADSIPWL